MTADLPGSICPEIFHPLAGFIKHEGFLKELLSECLSYSDNIDIRSELFSVESREIKWLIFSSESGCLELGLSGYKLKPPEIIRLLKSLRARLESSFQLSKDIFKPESFAKFRASSYQINSEGLSYRVLLVCPDTLSIPGLVKSSLKNFKLSLPLQLILQRPDITAPCSLVSDKLLILSPLLKLSGIAKGFICQPGLNAGTFYLSEEMQMEAESKIKSIVRLGALEMSLEQLLSLRVGSRLCFELPENSRVELEVAGRVIGQGTLTKLQDGSFKIEMNQMMMN